LSSTIVKLLHLFPTIIILCEFLVFMLIVRFLALCWGCNCAWASVRRMASEMCQPRRKADWEGLKSFMHACGIFDFRHKWLTIIFPFLILFFPFLPLIPFWRLNYKILLRLGTKVEGPKLREGEFWLALVIHKPVYKPCPWATHIGHPWLRW